MGPPPPSLRDRLRQGWTRQPGLRLRRSDAPADAETGGGPMAIPAGLPGAAGCQAAGWLKVPMSRAKPRMWVLMVKPTTAARTLGGRLRLGKSNAYTVI